MNHPLVSLLLIISLLSFHPVFTSAETATQISPVSGEPAARTGWWHRQPKENKILYTGATAAAVIGIWGLIEWDYGSAGWYMANEGWFQEDTKYGGADKLGHFWFTYAGADLLAGLYSSWGFEADHANKLAAVSSWSVQMAMEVMDATSKTQGFSWEDMVMNSLGAFTSVLFHHNPDLDALFDLKVEYVVNTTPRGLFDDYSNHYYSLAFKFDGIEAMQDSFLRYVELQGGYFSRGYQDDGGEKKRALFAGITLNFSRILAEKRWHRTAKTLEYLQIPCSVPKASVYIH